MRMKKLLSSGAGLLLALGMTLVGSAAALASSNVAAAEASSTASAAAHLREWVALIIGGRYDEAENFSPLHPDLRNGRRDGNVRGRA